MTLPPTSSALPEGTTALLVLADGTVCPGQGLGATGHAVGEICFNTTMTGYQEVLSDPSYAAQIICFTFPHIGNVGANDEDLEADRVAARGFVLREPVTAPSNWRADTSFEDWARAQGLIGISGVDTRRLTRRVRLGGAPNGVIAHHPDGRFDLAALLAEARAWPGLDGMELAREMTTPAPRAWHEGLWHHGGAAALPEARARIVVIDYGCKRNILRHLVSAGAEVTLVPADLPAAEILALAPDGILLSNGPGDPAATASYAVPILRDLLDSGLPILGICLGHQLLALTFGGDTVKMHQGHRGANHPVKDLASGRVAITSMNHGFTVSEAGFSDPDVTVTQRSLFDGSICGLSARGGRVISVQQHPEASPGPQDSFPLFSDFVARAVALSAG